MAVHEALQRVLDGGDLSAAEASGALVEIVDGDVSEAVISALLVALRMKGETPDEIAGFAMAMRDRAVGVRPKTTGLIDTCGTGGDGAGTVNVSTATALVVAGAGVPVAKHGNRALSSKAGSADVLEALGLRLDLTGDQVAACIDEVGIGFMFAPAFHPAMAKVMPVRRALGIRTAFNVLGPLTNPARPDYQLVGTASAEVAELVAGALACVGIKRAAVVHGAGGTDELTCAGANAVWLVEGGSVRRTSLEASEAGLDPAPVSDIAGGSAEENAAALRATLDGRPGPVLDCVVFNAAAALWVAGEVPDVRTGAARAQEVIESGSAGGVLDRWLDFSRAL